MAVLLLAMPGPIGAAGYFDGKQYPIVTSADFPADEFILDQARFWFEIYYRVSEDEGLLHDPFQPDLVLRKVRVPAGLGRASTKAVDAALGALRQELRTAAAKDEGSRTPAERELMSLLPPHWDTTHVQLCTERLRFQRGLKTKFRAGVERSYRYLPLIDSVFLDRGLPDRLKYLPHVESSFYPHAYSKVGAAGMWQFMKSSARIFKVKVGYHVDERRDPHASTGAAAGMLAYNYRVLKTWPLALVAYNHGPGGLARAVNGIGSRDLTTIIKTYYSNSFGFASKNFYAEFLAASSIALQADSLYPDLVKMEPLRFQRIVLPKSIGTRQLCAITGLSAAELEEYNLALRPATFRANAQLPKGHTLNLPEALDAAAIAMRLGIAGPALAAVKSSAGKGRAGAASVQAAAITGSAEGVGDVAAAPAAGPASAPRDKVDALAETAPAKARAVRGTATAGMPAPGTPAPKAAAARKAGKAEGGKEIAAAGPGELRASDPAAMEASVSGKDADPRNAVPMAVAIATPPASRPRPSLGSALAKVAGPALPENPVPAGSASARTAVVDTNFALQVSGVDKLAHPMDRFNPAIYNLGHEYAKGRLTIKVGTEETLSHYAEWAWIPEKTLRSLNRIRSARDLRMGRAIQIPIAEEKAGEFLAKREDYYRAMEEDFYGNYYVSSVEPLVVAKGMNLWGLVNEKEIPYWLLQKHNPGRILNEIRPGDTLSIPLIESGIRKWGFTRYGNSREYLAGISRFIAGQAR